MLPGNSGSAHAQDAGRTLRTDVLVSHEGRWCPGKVRAWHESSDGQRRALVTWNPVPGEIRIDRLPAEKLQVA